jgi:hypothetical protein
MWGLGYRNLIMLLAVIPVYDAEDDKGKKTENNERIDFGDNVVALSNFLNNIK